MKKMTKLAAAIALASGAMSFQTSAVELSANAGFVTDYYFRGANLGDAGAYGGLDADLGARMRTHYLSKGTFRDLLTACERLPI